VALVAEKLGTPLMPWQRQVADAALEIDPATGRLVYREVGLTVPRQSGKTTLILALAVHRALAMGSAQRIVYTAQTRADARKKWEDDHLPILQGSPFGPFFHPRKSAGNEAFLWRNGSLHGIMAVTKKSGHGPTIDLAFIDEAFAQEDARLEQACKPSMITRPSPQFWVVSTAGDLKSSFLRAKVDAGRKGRSRRKAYFEWSAPKDADPADEAVWWSCMPALGHTVPVEAIRADYESMVSEGNLAEFRRAYLNQWLDEVPAEWLVIPRDAWAALCAVPVAHGQVALAADVSPRLPGRDVWATIAASWLRPDGLTDVEIIEHRPGTAWLPGRFAQLVRKWRPCAAVIDAVGPAASLVDEIEGLRAEVVRPNTREVVQACGRFYDAVMDSATIRHAAGGDLNDALDAAVAGAVKRDLGDGWAWDRKSPDVDISPLVACTLASWAHAKFAKRQAPYNMLRSVS